MHLITSIVTEENQHVDIHECVKAYVPNRVGDNDLDKVQPERQLNELENGSYIFDKRDHTQQRRNYKTLVQRIITRDITCLQPLQKSVLQHIPHPYSKELSQKVEMVSLIIKSHLRKAFLKILDIF